MNNSQLLYKISNLQYSIRMKEVEYTRAANAGDQQNMDLHNAALAALKEDLSASVEQFNSIPLPGLDNQTKGITKARWWQSFFNLKAAITKK
jgi:hypothetical protein